MSARDWAQPGDADLDIDITGCTITAVVHDGRELLVRATGGSGTWISVTGERVDVATVTDLDFHLDLGEPVASLYAERLTEWLDAATPLRVVGAPGRMTTLIETRNRWLPLPRRPHPDWVDG